MVTGLDELYQRLPIPLQEAALAVWALRLHYARYGGRSRKLVDDLIRRERKSVEEIQADQTEMLRARALLALRDVPAYADLRDRESRVLDARSAEEILESFPVLTKDVVRRAPHTFVPTSLRRRRLIHGTTSGTTGTPLVLFRTAEGVRRNFAFFRRIRAWRGLSHWNRTATFMGRLVVPAEQSDPPYWRRSHTTRNLWVSSYHLADDTIEQCARAVAAFEPEQIVCYPSSGELIAEGLRRLGTRLQGCRAVFTTAETVLPAARVLMEERFGCNVADQYGSAEWTVCISQCEQGSYHLHPEYGYLEVVDDDDRPVREGCGRAIATGFVNDAMVLMRYDTGDNVRFAPDQACGCGRSFLIISSIEGRSDELIRTPEGRWVGRLDPVFKGQVGILRAQIEQITCDKLEVRIVPTPQWNQSSHAALVHELRRRLGPTLMIDVRLVDEIPLTANGKFRAVIGLPRGDAVNTLP